MEGPRYIRFRNLGIVAVAMDPQNPITKFDEMLEKAVPAGKIYQLAIFDKENTRFELVDDIARQKINVAIFDVEPNTYCKKLNGDSISATQNVGKINGDAVNVSMQGTGRFCVWTKCVDFGTDKLACIFQNLWEEPKDDSLLDMKTVIKNNDRFVKIQIKMLNKQLKKEKKGNILEPEF